ncbi:MAG: hypothetical protein ACE5R4_16965 [Armatimonadota bacterium]
MEGQSEELEDEAQDEQARPPRWVVWWRGALSLLGAVVLLGAVAASVLWLPRGEFHALGAVVVIVYSGAYLLAIGVPSCVAFPGLRRGRRWAAWVAIAHDGLVALCVLALLGWSALGISQGQYESIPWDVAAVLFAVPFVVEGVVLWRWVRGASGRQE